MAEYFQGKDNDDVLAQIASDMRDMRDRVIKIETKMESAAKIEPTVTDLGQRVAVLEDRDENASDAPARWGALVGIAVGAVALLERAWGGQS